MRDYKTKLNELANQGNTNWILAAIDGDNVGNLKQLSEVGARYALKMLCYQLIQLCENAENKRCLAFRRGGDEFSVFIDCNGKTQQDNKAIYAKTVLDQLLANVRKHAHITISVGYTFLEDDELGDEWEDRAEQGLLHAKKNGKDQAYFVK